MDEKSAEQTGRRARARDMPRERVGGARALTTGARGCSLKSAREIRCLSRPQRDARPEGPTRRFAGVRAYRLQGWGSFSAAGRSEGEGPDDLLCEPSGLDSFFFGEGDGEIGLLAVGVFFRG